MNLITDVRELGKISGEISADTYETQVNKISKVMQINKKKTRQSRRYAENLRDTALFRG